MTKEALEAAAAFERLGIIGILIVLLMLAFWVVRHLYKEKSDADSAIVQLTSDVGEVKGDVKAMNAKLDADQGSREIHRKDMELLHRSVLEAINK